MSSLKRPPIVFCDSCVLINWMSRNPQHEKHNTGLMFEQVDKGEIELAISPVVVSELNASHNDPSKLANIRAYYQGHSHVIIADIGLEVGELASELRSNVSRGGKEELKTPDALILAGAIVRQAKFLFTFDTDFWSFTELARERGVTISEPQGINGEQALC